MRKWAAVYLLGCALMPFLCIDAKPTGFHLKSGDARPLVQNSADAFVIQSSQNSLIDWESFSIDPAEHVRFEQQRGNNYVLNRVVGGSESRLLGALSSNGAVYLINPNGILIGPQAQIETAGFLASTLDLLDADLSFFGATDKGIVNQGKIHCPVGNIFLIGRTVENSGALSAPAGQIGLLSGYDVLICPDRAPQVQIRSEHPIDSDILNENPYSLAIRHSGSASAQEVYLIAEKGISEVTGTITALKGDKGGHVRVLGDEVLLLGQAEIDVSGSRGGGEALFGGDYQGKNPSIKNAKHLFVEKEVKIRANALEEGNGGKVILWSDETTIYYGHIGIRGGEAGGNGGFAEISGAYLNFQGLVDGKAVGTPGSVLLDPTNITISTSADQGGGAGFVANSWVASSTPSNINTTTLVNLLNGPNDVVVDTTAAGSFGASGTITVSNPVSWSAASKLTLTAASQITVNSSITNTNNGGAFDAIAMTSAGAGAGGATSISILGAISTVSGNISLTGTSTSGATQRGISLTTGSVVTSTGSITLNGQTGSASTGIGILVQGSAASVISSTSGDITLSGHGSGTAGGSHGVSIAAAWTPGTSGQVIFSNCIGGNTGVSNGISVAAAFSTAGNVVATNNIKGGTGAGSIGFSSNSNFSSSGGSIQITAASQGSSGSCHGISLTGGSMSTTGGGSITLSGTGGSGSGSYGVSLTGGAGTVSTTTGNGSISITGAAVSGGINYGININGSNAAVINSTSGPITISGSSTSSTGGSHGLNIAASWTTGTSGMVTFSHCTASGGSVSHGINVAGAFATSGDVVATDTIQSSTAGGVGFLGNANFSSSGGSIQITARGQGAGSSSHGISLTGGSLSTAGGGSITLSGTGGIGSSSHGVSLTGGAGTVSTTTGNGSISITGTSGTTTIGATYGVFINGSNAAVINSTSGPITISGSSHAMAAASHAVNIAKAWTTGTSGTVTCSNCVVNGIGSASHGINVAAAFSTSGDVVATDTIQGGTGSGSVGVLVNANFASSGGSIQMTASSQASAGAAHGISFTGGSMSTGSGSITLIGNSGASNTASFGVNLNDATDASITSSSGIISVTGTSLATVAGSHGISIVQNWTCGTTSLLTLTGSGGATGASHGINIPTALINTGAITLNGTAGGGVGSFGTSFGANVTTSGGAVTVTGTSLLAASTVTIDSTNSSGTPAGAAISFGGAINASTAGSQALTLNSGSTGAITFSGIVGGTTRLGAILVSSAAGSSSVNIGNNITANSFTITNNVPTILAGSSAIDTSIFGGPIFFGGAINGTLAGSQALTLNSGSTGAITFSGIIGETTRLGAILISSTAGSSSVNIGNNITANSFTITNNVPTILAGSSAIDTSIFGGAISFGGTINGGYDLIVDGGVITFGSTVGDSSPLNSISAIATGQINTAGNHTVVSGPMSYDGDVVLTTATQFTDGGTDGISFQKSISGNFDLTLLASSSDISVIKNIDVAGSAGSAGGSVTATGGSHLLFRGQILTQGDGAGAGGDVSLTSSGGSIEIQNINASTDTGIAGDITLTPASGYSGGFPIGRIVINRDLSAGSDGNLVAQGLGADGTITLSANRTSPATVATIVSSVAGNSIEVFCGTFVVGPYEAMTALGDISLFASLNLTLGDVVALTAFSPFATVINLLTHGDEALLDNNGFFYISPSLHFFGGSAYSPSGTFVPSGPIDARPLNLSIMTFRPLLLYGDPIVLNYDIGPIIPASVPGTQFVVYQLGVASAQLSDLLPIFEPACPPIYRHKSELNCRKFVE